jgi:ArsR family transcriptional regulator, arsenate/arsenite/antimonite-responsive transcriptional repressor
MTPESLFAVLSDPTRLRAVMLLQSAGEICVCEFTHAMGESQPKVSRHLAFMRDAGLVKARRQGTWMHYRLDLTATPWVEDIITATHNKIFDQLTFRNDLRKLKQMKRRPERACA